MHPPRGQISQQQRDRAAAIVLRLAQTLDELDAIEEGVAAAHVSMAIDLLRKHYALDADI